MKGGNAHLLVDLFKPADPTFRLARGQPNTAVNTGGVEVETIIRQADLLEQLARGRCLQYLVIAPTGEMATMHTVHWLDFVRLKLELSQRPGRDPLKAPKDHLQAEVVQQLWDQNLRYLEVDDQPLTNEPRPSER